MIFDDNVWFYVCGLIVYDFVYIGNVCFVIVFDVLFCLLSYFYGGDYVIYVCNIIDVEDKINVCVWWDYLDFLFNEVIVKVMEKIIE